jgi:uncharacterized protein YoxC
MTRALDYLNLVLVLVLCVLVWMTDHKLKGVLETQKKLNIQIEKIDAQLQGVTRGCLQMAQAVEVDLNILQNEIDQISPPKAPDASK